MGRGSIRTGRTAKPSARFVTLCTREPAAAPAALLERAAAAVQDWAEAVEVAVRHRVAAFVQAACGRVGIDLPQAAQESLSAATVHAAARTLALDVELRRIDLAFAERQVPVIVLKGPVLARTLYPMPAARPYNDLDLVVPVARADAAVVELIRLGYEEVPFAAEQARRKRAPHVHHGAAYHRQFLHGTTGVLVELHLDPLQLGLQPTCEAERWQRALPVPGLCGALMLAPEDQLVQLAVHAHKHGYERLIWLKDLDLLLRAHGGTLKRDLVIAVARREGVTPALWLSLCLTRELLATPGTEALLARLRPAAALRWLYRLVWPRRRIHNLHGQMRRRAVQFHAAESLRGMVPSLVLLGRRRDRARAILSYLLLR